MLQEQDALIERIVRDLGPDGTHVMDVARAVSKRFGYIPNSAIPAIAKHLKLSPVEVRDMITFYGHLSTEPLGTTVVWLCNAVVENMMGAAEVATAFERETGIRFGETTADGEISLRYTACIGLSDQAPSALINGVPFTGIHPELVREIVRGIRAGLDLTTLPGSGVRHNLKMPGEIIFRRSMEHGAAIDKLLKMSRDEALEEIKRSGVRGAGGAGFPAGKKWELCRNAPGDKHYVICNADEGEPGTFKDRVLLSYNAHQVFEGMTTAAYVVGATEGIVYLRDEYDYLRGHLDRVLTERREKGVLGDSIRGSKDFRFDIRIEVGAGSYVVGEESALIESLEGRRAAPRERPPFPVERGYLSQPTIVSNVETFTAAAAVMERGAEWFRSFGTDKSPGTKLLSISGDVQHPGVYEIEYGTTIRSVLDLVGARNAQAVQIGGASGRCISTGGFERRIAFEDVPTGGSFIVFGPGRDVVEYMRQFIEFFAEESCGWCTPCRVGTTLLSRFMDRLVAGEATRGDLDRAIEMCDTIRNASRCGLGMTAPNPLLTSLESMPELYERRLSPESYAPQFDLDAELRAGAAAANRPIPEGM